MEEKSMRVFIKILSPVIFLSLVLTTTALAVGDKYKLAHDQKLQKYLLSVNDQLGTKIRASIDWKTFEGTECKDEDVAGMCRDALSVLKNLGKHQHARKYIQKNVEELVCKSGGGKKRRIEVKNKRIRYFLELNSVSNQSFIRGELFEKL
jgi:hypothetical protein